MIGQNPKTSLHQDDMADDLSDITALLQSLPRVAVPMDFNASLKARIAVATAAEKEFAPVTAMIKELPRVAAPADFDFRLRARIAQAKAEQEKVAGGWLSDLFGQSFSWLQASAAMAAVALVVSVVTWGTLRSNNSVAPTDKDIATAKAPVQAPTVIDAPVATKQVVAPSETSRPIAVNTAATPKAAKVIRTVMPTPVSPAEKLPEIASAEPRTVIIKDRRGEERRVYISEYNLGLQTASLRTAAASQPKPAETILSANIY